MNKTSININGALYSDLYIFNDMNKIKEFEYVPSVEEFSTEVNRVLSQNILIQPHSKAKKAEVFRYATSCINQFFSNPIITTYLLRREVSVSEFGIPLYSHAERVIYDFAHMPYIFFRNPTLDRCPHELGLFAWGMAYRDAPSWQKVYARVYDRLARAISGRQEANARLNIPNYNAFNFLGIADEEIRIVLNKNKKRIEHHKNANPESHELRSIHYLDDILSFPKIVKLINSIKSGEFTFENNCNVFISGFDDLNGHFICAVLLVNKGDACDNSIVFELFLFNSQKAKESYSLRLKNDFKIALGDDPLVDGPSSIPLTYVSYNLQLDGVNAYEKDYSCVLYSVRIANKLVEIISSSESSAIRSRLLGYKGSGYVDTQEDLATYANELAQALLDFFDYDLESGSYVAKPFKDRQICNIAARWDLGRRFLKNYIRQYASDHQFSPPVFKYSIQ